MPTTPTRSLSGSRAAAPGGSYVGDKGDPYASELIVRDLDMNLLTEVRNRWQFYRDRRPDAYDDLVRP